MNMIKYSESECMLIRAGAFIRSIMANGLYNISICFCVIKNYKCKYMDKQCTVKMESLVILFLHLSPYLLIHQMMSMTYELYLSLNEPVHEISNSVVCATNKASDQPAHTHSLIRAFAVSLNILWLLSFWLNIIWTFYAWKEAAQAGLSLHLSKCHIVGNHMSWLKYYINTEITPVYFIFRKGNSEAEEVVVVVSIFGYHFQNPQV